MTRPASPASTRTGSGANSEPDPAAPSALVQNRAPAENSAPAASPGHTAPGELSSLRQAAGSWLGGAREAGIDLGFPGQRLGLPAQGAGSVARFGRRAGAFGIDALLCAAIANGIIGDGRWSTAVFAAQVVLFTVLLGGSAGQVMLGMGVAPLHGKGLSGKGLGLGPGILAALVRTGLLCLLIPALIWDRDYRGLHDRLARTVLVRR